MEEEYLEKYKTIENEQEIQSIEAENTENIDILQNTEKLQYYNEYNAPPDNGQAFLRSVLLTHPSSPVYPAFSSVA